MMIQVPPRELTGGDAARNGVQQTEDSLRHGAAAFENRVMDDFVQKNGEVKDRQTLNKRQRYPDERILESNQSPRGERQDGELSSCNDEMPPGILPVQFAHLVARDRCAQLSSERHSVLGVVVGLHRELC